MASKQSHPRAAFGTVKQNPPGVLARGNLMYTGILAAIAMLPGIPITTAAFLLLLEAAAAAQTLAGTRGKGLASARDTKIDALWTAMHTLKTFVQGLANSLDSVQGAALIEAAGLLVAKKGAHEKLLLAATYVSATGLVHLAVNVKLLVGQRPTKKTLFTWSWSSDGGKSWSSGLTTAYATAEVPALPPGTYLFRVQATHGKAVGEWSTQTASVTIH
jgi:hypothetical protein